jgi:ATP-binding cassette subfamily B protein
MFKQLTSPFKYEKIPLQNKDKKWKKRQKQKMNVQTLYRLWQYLSVKKVLLSIVLLMVLASSGLGLLGPYLIGITIDEYIVTREEEGLFPLIIVLIIIYVCYSISFFLQNYLMIGVSPIYGQSNEKRLISPFT